MNGAMEKCHAQIVYVSDSNLNTIHTKRASSTSIAYGTSTTASAAKDKLKALMEDADVQLLKGYYYSSCTLSPSETKDDNHPNLVLRLYNESGALNYYMDPHQSTNWTIASDLKFDVIKTFIKSAYKLNFSYSGVTPGGETDPANSFSTRIVALPYTLSPVRSTFDLWTEVGLLCTGIQSNMTSTNNQFTLMSPIMSTSASCQRPTTWPQPGGDDSPKEYSPSLTDMCAAIADCISGISFVSSAAASHPSGSSTGTATKTTWEYDGASTSISGTFTIT